MIGASATVMSRGGQQRERDGVSGAKARLILNATTLRSSDVSQPARKRAF